VIHIHGGGHQGLPKWVFSKFNPTGADYDVIGLSFYPGGKDSFDDLKQNLDDVIKTCPGKDVLIAEVAYPNKPTDQPQDANQPWPLTQQGQAQFVRDLMIVVRAAPDGRAIGAVWWYPESIPVKGLTIWKSGAMALFDEQGNALPALDAFGKTSP
jgi:arabinogalactan endo-1,4-beta-galactosidase